MPCTSPSGTIEQLRVTLEPGNTVIGLVCSHTDEEQEDFISHFMPVVDEASVEWEITEGHLLTMQVNWKRAKRLY